MEEEIRVIPDEVAISIRFGVQEPFTKEELTDLLIKREFESIPGPERIEELGAERVSIARKRGCVINYDRSAGWVEAKGEKYHQTFITFEEVESILKEEDDIFSGIKSYEFSSKNRVNIKKPRIRPLEAIGNFLDMDKFHKFEEITGIELTPFCIRVCPKEKIGVLESLRETQDWLDLYIFPYITNPKYFAVWLVFRDKDGEKVKKFAKEAENKAKEVVKALLGGERDG